MYAAILLLGLGCDDFRVRTAAEEYAARTADRRTAIALLSAADEPEARHRLHRAYRDATIRELDAIAARNGGYFDPMEQSCPWPGSYGTPSDLYPEFVCPIHGVWNPDTGSWTPTTKADALAHCRSRLIAYALRTGDMAIPTFQLETHGLWPFILPFRSPN